MTIIIQKKPQTEAEKALEHAIELYKNAEITLAQAAARSGLAKAKFLAVMSGRGFRAFDASKVEEQP